MKTAVFLFLVALLAVSCSKDEQFQNLAGTNQQPLAAAKAAREILVYPGGDASASITEAFETAKTMATGATVKLMPGTYELKSMIEVREFFGTFTGSGKDVSIITNHDDLAPDDALASNKKPAILRFVGGDVTVSNMTISLSQSAWWDKYDMFAAIFTAYTSDFTPKNQHIRAVLDNIIVSGFLPLWNENGRSTTGIQFGPDCVVSGLQQPLASIDAFITNSCITSIANCIGASGCRGNFNIWENLFDKSGIGVATNDNLAVLFKIHDNTFKVSRSVDMAQGGWNGYETIPGLLGRYEIVNNIITPDPETYNMGFFDCWRVNHPDDPRYMEFLVANNTFDGDGLSIVPFAVKNGMFSNNIHTGKSGMDIYGLFWVPPEDPYYEYTLTEGCRFINNKFTQASYLYFEFDTQNNLTVGDLSKLDIYDFGTNNMFNARKAPTPSGQALGLPKSLEQRIKWIQERMQK